MTIQESIEKAIEGGYKRFPMPMTMENRNKTGRAPSDFITYYSWEPICYDPLFWKSLGKAMGWWNYACGVCGEAMQVNGECRGNFKHKGEDTYGWLYHWHRFIDHLAEGKDAESFFENL